MLDKLAKQLFDDLKQFSRQQRDDPSESQIKAIFAATLRKFNLVTREEFDTQTAVLLRTREKIDAMEKQINQLEQLLAQKSATDNQD